MSGNAPQVSSVRVTQSLAWRELIRFFRQRNRVIGAIGTPLFMWLLFGFGLDRSFSVATTIETNTSFLEYYFPGSLVLILMFTAIYTTISVIEDRQAGFLQGVLIAPVHRHSMVAGKVLGGSIIAMIQGVLFLAATLFLEINWSFGQFITLVAVLFIASMMMTCVGFSFAWKMESTQGFHAVMNLVLMPMWLLSGAFFPVPVFGTGQLSQDVLHWVMKVNPLTHVVSLVRNLLYETRLSEEDFWEPSGWTSILVILVATVVFFAWALKVCKRRTAGDFK
ncbi:MAG: multidrug ABC transporter permease [Planctomycetaceae bacterium]|nr:multidrug ABC transporter permease [Planctomycetaceae bacterium]|tara:strand:+ start:292 stop:1128 length:837 start_codon:yes stop_codon:yes gene_type:complete